MKKSVILLLIINVSIFLYATNFNIGTTLILDNKEYINILYNDNAASLVKNLGETQFDDFEINTLDYITKICNYLTIVELTPYFYQQKLYNEQLKDLQTLKKNVLPLMNSYSSTLSNSGLATVNDTKNQIDNFREISNIDDLVNTDKFNFSFTNINPNPLLGFLLLNNNKITNDKIFLDNNIDALLLISVSSINNLKRFKIEYYDKNKRETIYDKILTTNFISDNSKEILSALTSFFNDDYSITSFINKSNSKVEEINNISKQRLQEADINDWNTLQLRSKDLSYIDISKDYLITKKGIHYYKISNSFTSEIKKVEITDDTTLIDIKLEETIIPNINLISKVGMVNFKLNGKQITQASAFNIENQKIPFYFEVEKEGFLNSTIQNNSNLKNIEFSLKPLWMEDSLLIDQAQNDFYSSLFTYCLISLATLSINNVNDAFGSSDLTPFLDVFSTSIVSLSSLNIIYKLISYIKLATT